MCELDKGGYWGPGLLNGWFARSQASGLLSLGTS